MRRLLWVLLVLASASGAFAWGGKAHELCVLNATELLPAGPLREFLTAQYDTVCNSTLDPDEAWKMGTIAHLEEPNHYLDLEWFSADGRTIKPSDLPLTRQEAERFYTFTANGGRGVRFSDGGFVLWRIEEVHAILVNAMKTDRRNVAFWAGVLAHYAVDATQPLHVTVHFDGRRDNVINGRKELQGIHHDYETEYLTAPGLEFQQSSQALASPPVVLTDIHAAAADVICASFTHVDEIYAAARKSQGPNKYRLWDQEIGPMTRRQLAQAATFVASLWLTAWEAAGQPKLPTQQRDGD